MNKLIAILVISAFCASINAEEEKCSFPIKALAPIRGTYMDPKLNETITIDGFVRFTQEGKFDTVKMFANLTFSPWLASIFDQGIAIGSHFHKYVVRGEGQCKSAGPHFNPKGSIPEENAESGELGNYLFWPREGKVMQEIAVSKLKMYGPETIVGRSFVFHERPDKKIISHNMHKKKSTKVISSFIEEDMHVKLHQHETEEEHMKHDHSGDKRSFKKIEEEVPSKIVKIVKRENIKKRAEAKMPNLRIACGTIGFISSM